MTSIALLAFVPLTLAFTKSCQVPLYELIPNMPEHRLAPLMEAFAKALSQAGEFNSLFAQAK